MSIHRRELKSSHSGMNLYYSSFWCHSNLSPCCQDTHPIHAYHLSNHTHDSITPLPKICHEAQLSHRIWNQCPFTGSPTFSLSWHHSYAPHFPSVEFVNTLFNLQGPQ